nr:hypothetical protein HUO10_005906 [Paraburkholderia busanensis]
MEQEPTSLEEQIRTRAYYLWERATDPKGTPDEYWEQARAEVEGDADAPPVESGPVDPAAIPDTPEAAGTSAKEAAK